MKKTILLALIFLCNLLSAQNSIIKLNAIDELLSKEAFVKLSDEIIDKDMVFLGESEHHIGSDFLAKTEFVKFLVLEHGYKNIAFEGDFFALYLTNDRNNLFPQWSKSTQCKELFLFLEKHNVKIWGFDNQFSSGFSFYEFTPKLFSFLDTHKINYDLNFKKSVEIVCTRGPEFKKVLSANQIASLIINLDELSKNKLIVEDEVWYQFISSFKSLIILQTSSKSKAYSIRDHQMANNLNFIANKLQKQKIIVWAANAHSSKLNQEFMKGKTMGYNFINQSDRKTYHIAFAPIKMPYRTSNFIISQAKNNKNLLFLLPNLNDNHIVFSNNLEFENISIQSKKFKGMFGMSSKAINYFEHFDALVFIANGEKNSYFNNKNP